MPRFDRHLFICTDLRAEGDKRGCCQARGGTTLRGAFKLRLAQKGLAGRVRANKSGCLDACAQGPVMVVYPEQVWYCGVTLGDVDEIVERHLIGGEVVERLLMPTPEPDDSDNKKT